MPDLLSHVLLTYAVVTIFSLCIEVSRWKITACLFGAILPDVSKIGLFVDDDVFETLVGAPIEFLGWHTLVGVMLSILLASLLVHAEYRRITAVWISVGAAGHLFLDAFVRTASGLLPYALFWPATSFRPRTPDLYLSGDPEVLVVSMLATGVAWLIKWRFDGSQVD